MTSAADAVRARRKLTNRLIAAHDAGRLRPFLHPEITLITGDGTVIAGASAVLEAFAAQFADPAFVTYERTTASVDLDQDGARAAEAGRWIATWRDAPTLTGTYLAAWRKVTGQWVIESELYVTLS
ncbi:MAG: nuclear transport factor 2 family protein [Caulobacter sp.]|nr:nuclear transport factor 2 family protein [Caulobacter sp.]